MKHILALLFLLFIPTNFLVAEENNNYHNKDQCERFEELSFDNSNYFAGSGNCQICYRSNGIIP